ncbi:MAG: cobalamin B12-binding domain-containing protein [Candidatus Omnitrophica bacterium]|nr:cobalamin B12-binding domain-containing protein [Candidatus Omnitrophota bacterium]
MAKILFFNPPARQNVYIKTNVKVGAPSYPSLTLATLAAYLVKENAVKIIDLDLLSAPFHEFFEEIRLFNPDIICSTATTPNYTALEKLMSSVKKENSGIKTIVGGVHVTARPEEAYQAGCFDIIVLGEADRVIAELIKSTFNKKIPGVIFKEDSAEKIKSVGRRPLIEDLDELEYPAWHLFDIKKYKNSRLSSRKNPVGHIETSRGCAFECNFCSKLTFGMRYRVKNPQRVVDEMEYMLKCGFKEIHIADDSFTQDIKRAKEVCREIIKRGLKFPWSLINGIRVNMLDPEFLSLARQAGCWQTGFGIETGNQEVLEKISKKTTVSQIEKAVKMVHESGIETFGFFIFALSGETEKSMQDTIDLAKRLPLDTAKFDICVPYPGTRYFDELESSGNILSKDWSKYICHQVDDPLYKHQNLSWQTISRSYKKAVREFYLRPSYVLRRFIRSIRKGDFIFDILYFLQTRW